MAHFCILFVTTPNEQAHRTSKRNTLDIPCESMYRSLWVFAGSSESWNVKLTWWQSWTRQLKNWRIDDLHWFAACFKTVDSQAWQLQQPVNTNSCWSLEVVVITCELWERQGLVVMPTLICNYYLQLTVYYQFITFLLYCAVLIVCSVLCLSLFVQDSNVWLCEGLCLSVLFFTLMSLCSGLGDSRGRTRSHGRSCRASLATKMYCWNLSWHVQNLHLLFHVLQALNFWSELELWTALYLCKSASSNSGLRTFFNFEDVWYI